ncbi:hypothetical protein SAMN04515674_10568 [Pseudarcicella hirudinis]|uniref:Uncharacterized protein n=1 Tax=Pseudarcicella hirudinis TaxID=1079859 RepID=A0A1I5SK65_9BACT|nr:hypothetical protein [Pseudarcicella hirudinis]SFP71194.1 hypothetical protein SAMN04515674_10568 [Pseudarcicella hirudinis]
MNLNIVPTGSFSAGKAISKISHLNVSANYSGCMSQDLDLSLEEDDCLEEKEILHAISHFEIRQKAIQISKALTFGLTSDSQIHYPAFPLFILFSNLRL